MPSTVAYSGLGNVSFTSGGSDQYITLSSGALDTLATEASVQIIHRTSGYFSSLWVFVGANSTTGTTSVRTRINGVNGNQSVSIGTLATGFFQDTTHQDVIAAGTKVCLSISNSLGVGSVTISTVAFVFTTSAPQLTVTKYTYLALSASVFSTASKTFYSAIASGRAVGNQSTTEVQTQNYCGASGNLANLFINVTSNPRGTATTIGSRKNTANGNLSVSIGATATGFFEDTTNTDTLASGDLINYIITTGSGGGSLVCEIIGSTFSSTNRTNLVIFGNPTNQVTQIHTTTTFLCVGGWMNAGDPVENNVRTKALLNFIASKLSIYVDNNNVNGASTITLRKNAANTLLSVSIGATSTGRFSDLVNTASILSSDILTHGFVTGGTSGATFNLSNIAFSTFYPRIIKGDIILSKGIVPFPR